MKVDRIHEKIHRILVPFEGGLVVYLYLLKGDQVALVDTGVVESPRAVLQPALAQIGMSLADVDQILVTHVHMDHTGGNAEVKRASSAPIHVHSADIPRAQSTEALAEFMAAPLRVLELPAKMVQARYDRTIRGTGEPAGADLVLSDGDTLDLGAGLKLRVVHTPGHTPGSVCYYWEREGLLLAGDAVQGQGSGPGGYPLYFNAPDFRRSIARIADLDPALLCMSHSYIGGGGVNDPTRAQEDARALLQESLQVADAIHGAVVGALRQKPDASKREIALSALSELVYQIPTLLDRESGMPRSGIPTLLAHIDAALAGSYPE